MRKMWYLSLILEVIVLVVIKNSYVELSDRWIFEIK